MLVDWKKIIISFFVVSVIVLFSGCLGGDKDTGFDASINAPDSVSIEFVPGNPPEQIYEKSPFSLAVKVQNDGNAKINKEDLWVHMIGVDPNSVQTFLNADEVSEISTPDREKLDFNGYTYYFSYTTQTGISITYLSENKGISSTTVSLKENVEKKLEDDFYVTVATTSDEDGKLIISGTATSISKSNVQDVPASEFFSKPLTNDLIPSVDVDGQKVPGGITQLAWPGLLYKESISSDQQLDFLAHSCYLYKSKATGRACFNVNPYSQVSGVETCTVNGEKEVGNEVGPIKVVSMNEYFTGKDNDGKQRYTFTLTVENRGDGSVFSKDSSPEECLDLTQQELNRVSITEFKIGTEDFIANKQCVSNNEIYLTNGVGEWTCTIAKEAVTGYDLVNIELEYGYTQQARKTLTLKNSFEDSDLYA